MDRVGRDLFIDSRTDIIPIKGTAQETEEIMKRTTHRQKT